MSLSSLPSALSPELYLCLCAILDCRPVLQDFMQCLPFQEYCHPDGPLNVARYLTSALIKPDLGPKSYIATGRSVPLLAPSSRPHSFGYLDMLPKLLGRFCASSTACLEFGKSMLKVALTSAVIKPDVGPKSCIATGRSATKAQAAQQTLHDTSISLLLLQRVQPQNLVQILHDISIILTVQHTANSNDISPHQA